MLEREIRKTLVVHTRYAWRSHRTKAAIDGEQGLLIVTIEQLVARLAGGFLQPIDADDLKIAVAAAVAEPARRVRHDQDTARVSTCGGRQLVEGMECGPAAGR